MNSDDFYRLLSIKPKGVKVGSDELYWREKVKINDVNTIIADTNTEYVEVVNAITKNGVVDITGYCDITKTFNLLDVTSFGFDDNNKYYYLNKNRQKVYFTQEDTIELVLSDGKTYRFLPVEFGLVLKEVYIEKEVLDLTLIEKDVIYIELPGVTINDINAGTNYYEYETEDSIKRKYFTIKDCIFTNGGYLLKIEGEDFIPTAVQINNNKTTDVSATKNMYNLISYDGIDIIEIASGNVSISNGEVTIPVELDDVVTIDGNIYIKSTADVTQIIVDETNITEFENKVLVNLTQVPNYKDVSYYIIDKQNNITEYDNIKYVSIDKKTYFIIEDKKLSDIVSLQYGDITNAQDTIYFKSWETRTAVPLKEYIEHTFGYIGDIDVHPLDCYSSSDWGYKLTNHYLSYYKEPPSDYYKYSCQPEINLYSGWYSSLLLEKIYREDYMPYNLYWCQYKWIYKLNETEDVYEYEKSEKISEGYVNSYKKITNTYSLTPILLLSYISKKFESWRWDRGDDRLFGLLYYNYELDEKNPKKIKAFVSNLSQKWWRCWYSRAYFNITQNVWGLYKTFCEGLRKTTHERTSYTLLSRSYPDDEFDIADSVFYEITGEDGDCKIFQTKHTKKTKDSKGNETVNTYFGGAVVSEASERFACTKNIPAPGSQTLSPECEEENCACYLAVYYYKKACSVGETASPIFNEQLKYVAEDVTMQYIKKTFTPNSYENEPKQIISNIPGKKSCFSVDGQEYKKQFCGIVYSKKGSKAAWEIFYNNFKPLAYGDLTCPSVPCPCENYDTICIPVGVTNAATGPKTISIPQNLGSQYAGGTVSLWESGGNLTYANGTIGADGTFSGIPPTFTSQYDYNGYMHLCITYCKD